MCFPLDILDWLADCIDWFAHWICIFGTRHPGTLLVVVGVFLEGVEIFSKIFFEHWFKKHERAIDIWSGIFWIIVVVGLAWEIPDAVKTDKEAAESNKEAAVAQTNAAAAFTFAAQIGTTNAQLVSNNLVLSGDVAMLELQAMEAKTNIANIANIDPLNAPLHSITATAFLDFTPTGLGGQASLSVVGAGFRYKLYSVKPHLLMGSPSGGHKWEFHFSPSPESGMSPEYSAYFETIPSAKVVFDSIGDVKIEILDSSRSPYTHIEEGGSLTVFINGVPKTFEHLIGQMTTNSFVWSNH
jgi:hypothetical protein